MAVRIAFSQPRHASFLRPRPFSFSAQRHDAMTQNNAAADHRDAGDGGRQRRCNPRCGVARCDLCFDSGQDRIHTSVEFLKLGF